MRNSQGEVFFTFKNIIVFSIYSYRDVSDTGRQCETVCAITILCDRHRITIGQLHNRGLIKSYIAIVRGAMPQLQRNRGLVVDWFTKIHVEGTRTSLTDDRVGHSNRRYIVIFNGSRYRIAVLNLLVVAARAALNPDIFRDIALHRPIIRTSWIRDRTASLTFFDDNFLTISQFNHQVSALRRIFNCCGNGDVLTFYNRIGAFQSNFCSIIIVRDGAAGCTARIQILVVTARCRADTNILGTIALCVSIIWIRIINKHPAFRTANRNRNSAAIGQRDDQILPSNWVIDARNDFKWLAFRDSLWCFQCHSRCASNESWIRLIATTTAKTRQFCA